MQQSVVLGINTQMSLKELKSTFRQTAQLGCALGSNYGSRPEPVGRVTKRWKFLAPDKSR